MSRLSKEIRAAIGDLPGWWTIEEGLEHVKAHVPDRLLHEQHDLYTKQLIRREAKALRDATGSVLLESIVTKDTDGKIVRRYKQIRLFSIDDFRQAVEYHADRGSYHRRRAHELAERCFDRFGVQIPFAFEPTEAKTSS